MPDYSWIAEKKVEAMRRKLQKRGMPDYRQLPVSQRYGVGFTGYGDDGKLNPEEPAGMELAGRQHIYHEGEMKADMPEGSMYLDANTTARAYPEMGSFQSGGASIEGAITGNGIIPYDPERQPQRRASAVPAVGTAEKIADGVVRAASRPAGTTVEAMQIQPTQTPDTTVNPVRAQTRSAEPSVNAMQIQTPKATVSPVRAQTRPAGTTVDAMARAYPEMGSFQSGGASIVNQVRTQVRPAGTVAGALQTTNTVDRTGTHPELDAQGNQVWVKDKTEAEDLASEMEKYYAEEDAKKPAESGNRNDYHKNRRR